VSFFGDSRGIVDEGWCLLVTLGDYSITPSPNYRNTSKNDTRKLSQVSLSQLIFLLSKYSFLIFESGYVMTSWDLRFT
jgi:hypothetical protein